MRRSDRQVKSTLELKVPQNGSNSSTSILNEDEQRLEHIRSAAISALKIVSIASMVDDDTSSDFFSSYDTFKQICDGLKNVGIVDESLGTESEFDNAPQDSWIKIILACFLTLYCFEDHGSVSCDILTTTNVEGGKPSSIVGTYFSLMIRLESYDWKEHKTDIFIPSKEGERILFLIDDEPVLYSNFRALNNVDEHTNLQKDR